MENAIDLYKSLSDPTRLRILHLLSQGSLCVCHIHEILEAPQAKVSRQLGYLKERGLVTSARYYNWTLYRLPCPLPPLLEANLEALKDEVFAKSEKCLADLERLAKADTSTAAAAEEACC